MGHPDQLQEFIDSLVKNRATQPEQMAVEPKKFLARQVVVKVGRFGKKSQPGLSLRIAELPAEQPGLSARWVNEPHQHLEGRGFPRAIRAEKTEYFPRPDFEVEAFYSSDSLAPEPDTENLGELFSLYHQLGVRRHGSFPCSRKTIGRLYLGKTVARRLPTFEKRPQSFRVRRTGDRTGLGIQQIVSFEWFLGQHRKNSRRHKIRESRGNSLAFSQIDFHSTLQYAKILFNLSLIHISEPTRLLSISYAVFCLKKKI